MKKNTSNKIVSGFVIVFALVAIFVLYSACFSSGKVTSSYGSCFDVMFSTGVSDKNAMVPLMIGGFACLLLTVILSFAGFILEKKQMVLLLSIIAVLLIANAVIFLFSVNIWEAVQGTSLVDTKDNALGSGSVCTIVFSFLGAATSLIGIYLNLKKED